MSSMLVYVFYLYLYVPKAVEILFDYTGGVNPYLSKLLKGTC